MNWDRELVVRMAFKLRVGSKETKGKDRERVELEG